MQAARQHTPLLPVLSLLLAATLWGIFWIPLRWLEGQGLQGLWMTMLIYCGTLVYIVPLLFIHRRELGISPGLLAGIAISSGWCNMSFILALLEGEVVRVILLFYLSPVWATLLARVVLKEKLSMQSYLVLLLALIGALIMLWSPEVGYPWPESQADWLALSSGFAFALTNMFINMCNQVSIRLKAVISWLGVIIVAGLALSFRTESLQVGNIQAVYYALLVGMLLMGIMTLSVVYGVTHMPVHRSAVILLFEVVASLVSTYLLIDERLDMLEWAGGGAVVLAAYFAARLPHHHELIMDT